MFTYPFDNHLAIGGGNFTIGQPVIVRVVRDDGVRELNRQVIARPHAVTPGGAVSTAPATPATMPARADGDPTVP